MVFSTLTAISPVDGRYRNKAENLAAYFSEYALIKYRVQVEIEYFITLSEFLPQLKSLATTEKTFYGIFIVSLPLRMQHA